MLEQRVILTVLTEKDLPKLYNWINDRHLVEYNTCYKPISELQHRQWFERISRQENGYYFGITLLKENKLIGTCQLINLHNQHRHAELQIRIGEIDYHGCGLGTEAVSLLLNFAFNSINLNRVFLHVFATNKRAFHLYEKIGFELEGHMKQHAYINGAYIDVIMMGMLRDKYMQLKSSSYKAK